MPFADATPSPLLLERYHFTKLHLDVLDGELADDGPNDLQVETDFRLHSTDSSRFLVELTLGMHGMPSRPGSYEVSLVVQGFFAFIDSEIPSEQRDALISNAAPTILYGAAREMIVGLTSRGPFPALILPSVRFPMKKLYWIPAPSGG
jgi:preprotein translocase subunit SecB